tara:strand:+ start:408 stop:1499 length:1092 start_codon:yes stop_codon:yes gene_type:complete
MILIAHRGNVRGSIPKLENNPEYVLSALREGFDAEIDVWFLSGQFWLGHDEPTYGIDESFLENDMLWCHAKNVEALERMSKNRQIHCFWHQEDNHTLTSKGYIWTYPGQKACSNSIVVMPEIAKQSVQERELASGVCSDYIASWKPTERHLGIFIQMTGLSGAGKSTLSSLVGKNLRDQGFLIEIIDGDEYRTNLCQDLGFSKEDRNTNIRRLGFVGSILARNGVVVIMAAINPYEEIRGELRGLSEDVKTVYVKADLDTLRKRDTKGLYHRADLPDDHPDKLNNLTGVSDPFDVPEHPDCTITTDSESIQESSAKLEKFIIESIRNSWYSREKRKMDLTPSVIKKDKPIDKKHQTSSPGSGI